MMIVGPGCQDVFGTGTAAPVGSVEQTLALSSVAPAKLAFTLVAAASFVQ